MTRSTSRRLFVAGALATAVAVHESASARQTPTPAADAEELARAFYEPFNTGETAIYDRILAPDWVTHPAAPGQQPGPESFKPIVDGFRAVFPDLQEINDEVIVAGDKVTVRSTFRGTQQGEFLDIPPTGKMVEIMAIDIHRIADGRIAETWHVEDFLGLLLQLGAVIQPGPDSSATPAA